MGQISPLGVLNTTALTVADVYVQIIPPQFLLNGVPSNIGGYVGTATWGPINQPVTIGSPQQYATNFGLPQARTFDMGTHVTVGFQEGATAMKCVRVTDGTDTAAAVIILSTCLTVTSKYSGSYGNKTIVLIATGSKPSTKQIRILMPGQAPEIFDNIAGSGNAFWVAAAAAINGGIANQRGPSKFVVASAGAGTTAAANGSFPLVGGTDGVTTINGTVMLGTDVIPRSGMYALRDQNVSVMDLCDLTDTATWATQDSFASGIGAYAILCGPAGQSIAAAITAKNSAALDSYSSKVLLGDWVYWNDTYNGISKRLISPQAQAAGKLIALAPQYSTLNRRLQSVTSTEKNETSVPYTTADLQDLALAGIDVICTPAPGGRYFALRNGHNSSSSAVVHGDNYTRMTNYIAATLSAGMGIYIGALQSIQPDDETRRKAKVTLDAFLAAMVQQKQLDQFKVVCDLTNNPPERIALGYMQADVKARYLAVVEFFIINLEGGQSVEVVQSGPNAAA